MMAALKIEDLLCMYLARHERESVKIIVVITLMVIFVIIIIIVIIIITLVCKYSLCVFTSMHHCIVV